MWVHQISSTLFDIEGFQASFLAPTLEPPASLKEDCTGNNMNGYESNMLLNDLNIPVKTGLSITEYETRLDNLPLRPQPQQQGIGSSNIMDGLGDNHYTIFIVLPKSTANHPSSPLLSADYSPPLWHPPPSQGPIAEWIAMRREEIVKQMTEACLNQSLDALLARAMLMREDYELVVNQPTRTAKVRQLLDNCHRHNEDFCRIVVRKLHDNKQMGLQPYPAEISSSAALLPSAPPLSMSCNIPRNV